MDGIQGTLSVKLSLPFNQVYDCDTGKLKCESGGEKWRGGVLAVFGVFNVDFLKHGTLDLHTESTQQAGEAIKSSLPVAFSCSITKKSVKT